MKNIFNKFILVVLLVSTSFFYFIPIDILVITKVISILFCIIIFLNVKVFLKNRGIFRFNILFFLVIVISQIVISKTKYNQDIDDIVTAATYYFIPLIYYFVNYYINEYRLKFLKKALIVISLITSSLLLFQYLLFEYFNVIILSLNLSAHSRFGTIRITAGALIICIGIILSVGKIIGKEYNTYKDKVLYLSNVVIGITEIVFVSKTRSVLFFITSVIFIMICLSANSFISKLKVALIISVTFIIITNSSIINKYNNEKEVSVISTTARLGAIQYYIDKGLEMPLWGMGIINENNKYDYAKMLLHGNEGVYYRDDVGIIGLFNTFGLLGVAWYLGMLYIILKSIIRKRIRNKTMPFEEIGLFLYLLLSSTTIIITDPQRIMYLPFILVIIEE